MGPERALYYVILGRRAVELARFHYLRCPMTKLRYIVLLLLISSGKMLFSQNLVSNPSFEEYSVCPDLWNQTSRATGWSSFRSSTDYFNTCDGSNVVGVPENFAGYQPD